MATDLSVSTALDTISRHHLECSICQERYKLPKILNCLHSFCEQCLLKYYSEKHQGCTQIPCPVCRQETQLPETELPETELPETGVQELHANLYLAGLVEEIALQEKVACSGDTKLLCEICDGEKNATHYCLDCAQNICPNCQKMHIRFAVSSSHTIATLEDIRNGKVTPKRKREQKCPEHEGEVARFICTRCQMLICGDCTIVDHCKPGHAYMDRNEALLLCKEELAALCSPLEETLKELQESRETVSSLKHELGIAVDQITREVRNRADELRSTEITAQENRLIDDIKNIQTDRIKKLDEHEKTTSILSGRIKYSLETARDVTKNASDANFLSLVRIIGSNLQSFTSADTPRIDQRLFYLKFKQSVGGSEINLGKVVSKWELCREFGKNEFYEAWDVAVRCPGEIAVADTFSHRVVTCSIDGNHKRVIDIKKPCAIAATRVDDRLVVVTGSVPDVKVFNNDNTLAFQFSTVPPSEVGNTEVFLRSVAVKTDGTIVVGDIGRMVLTEHSSADGSLLSTIPVKMMPCFLAVDKKDRVIISDLSSEVHVADSTGATVFTIKPTIEGTSMIKCKGVHVYIDGSDIYVAMCPSPFGDTGHIHQYDTQGVFLKCIVQDLTNPKGIALTADGQLLVAEKFSVRMYHEV